MAHLNSLSCRARTSVRLALLDALRARTCACQQADEGPFIGLLVVVPHASDPKFGYDGGVTVFRGVDSGSGDTLFISAKI